MSAVDKIDNILSYVGVKAPTFASSIGVNYQRILDIQIGKTKSISSNLASIIVDKYPEIDLNWLLTGEGSMLKNEIPALSDASTGDELILSYEIPLLPVAVYGGTLDGFGVSGIMPHECEHIISPLKNAELAVPVVGDSMAPEYPNGSRVLVRKVNDAAFLEWGAPYVLDTCNGAVLKIIAPSDKHDYIKCISLNKAPEYAPFEIAREHINGIYRVLMCMALK